MKPLAVFCAAALAAVTAHAETLPSPHGRGEVVYQRHANGLQYPRYEPAAGQSCAAPAAPDALRQRLVDLAAQEWARFGYRFSRRGDAAAVRARFVEISTLGLKPRPYDENDPLVLAAVGGYWAALSGVAATGVADVGGFEIGLRNARWRRNAAELRSIDGWTTPWSAAFVSWLMCEAGAAPFQRSWAHRDYVDAAIAAADGARAHRYRAHGPDHPPEIGDLVCASRAGYRTDLEARREDSGGQGDMHCDLVVARDAPSGLVLAIGGNVEDGVTLVSYRLTRRDGRWRLRSTCLGAKLCAEEDERLFAVLALDAPLTDAALAASPALAAPPQPRLPRFR